jgi:hypothetical protein
MASFSSRHGYRGNAPEISVREDASADLRSAVLLLAKQAGMTPKPIREVVCEVLLKKPDDSNWSEYPNVWNEANELVEQCEWFRVYDIAEALHAHLSRGHDTSEADVFEERLNEFFIEHGIGWKMAGGEIVFRGSEVFAGATADAVEALTDAGHHTAAREVHEALRDISRRPEPDVTGAIQHVIAALECAARDVTGKSNATLGKLVPELNLPAPLDAAVTKLWGFSSDKARHLREGEEISTEEAELVVSIACALCTFLSRR